ncbi:oxidoreductase [Antarcticibacterium flavum]|uniref:Oxidoreductase n=1 Tax=Antarcticibacterium flavum TaxID=2058175 RepID=A0A5B7X2F0_9FLAO|nr:MULTISPECIES: Gfo/Idh/MocA family oxidoreductase [Antarcticibacterium]MCM4160704.1 oxidoreductase [Antarcticibacterium sp. W02-3]QCY68818.1 oxidoreductase [Antarcticibacterium flavum]
MKKVHVAMAGFGKGGRIYNAPVISSVEGMEIKKILTSSRENISAAGKDFPDALVVNSFEEILEDPEINLIVITTPNHLHKDYATKALQAGKHVVLEKPITPLAAQAEELIRLAREKELILSVHHNRRWDSDFLTIQKLLDDKKLGEVVEYEAHFDRFRPEIKESWKENPENPGSGILYDLGSHLIDQALVLFGLPTHVFADVRVQRKTATVADSFELLLYYPNLKVTLKAGMLVKGKTPTFLIHGTKGSFIKYGQDPQEEKLKAGFKPAGAKDWGLEPKESWGSIDTIDEMGFLISKQGDYSSFYSNIYKAITSGEELEVKPEEAKNVIRIIEAALRSQAEGRKVEFY